MLVQMNYAEELTIYIRKPLNFARKQNF